MRLAILACAVLVGCGSSAKSDWERENEAKLAKEKEDNTPLPSYPSKPELLEFKTRPTSAFRFFIDARSISVDEGVVRYTLVARSDEGAQNVSYEGMRCSNGEVKIYAVGRDGKWSGKPGDWRSPLEWHRVLATEYFCPIRNAIRSQKEGIWALQQGGHPFYKGLTGDEPRGGAR